MPNPDANGEPYPPPNLRTSKDENRECDNCKMHTREGLCWGYGNLPVNDEWVCDSWERNPMGTDEGTEVTEDDPYESFAQALDAAKTAADKLFGKEKKEPSTLKEASKLARLVFAERRKAPVKK